jgi:hypothetical protein
MKGVRTVLMIVIVCCALPVFGGQHCKTVTDLLDKHVVRYRAYNGTIRGCEVKPEYYTNVHKMNRGRMLRRDIMKVCEGSPISSPRTGPSFEICPYRKKKPSSDKQAD